jgi:hypothetical protein
MDPMDLKNSEELKSALPLEPEQQNDAVAATDDNSVEKKEIEMESQGEQVVEPDKSETGNSEAPPEPKPKRKAAPKKTEEEPQEDAAPEAKVAKPRAKKKKETEPETAEPDATNEGTAEAAEPKEEVEEIKEIPAAPEVGETVAATGEPIETPAEALPEISDEAIGIVDEAEPDGDEEFEPSGDDGEEKTGIEGEPSGAAKKEVADYTIFSQFELVNALRELLDNNMGEDIKDDVEAIKAQFYKLQLHEVEEQKIKFIEGGGVEEEFAEEENPYEQDIKDLLKRYRNLRIEFNKKQEVAKEENLKQKYQVIDEIKNLINREESINKTFHEFRELQNRWREIGLVPQSKMKDLWDTYNFHVENFYDYIKINKELRDLDLKKNLEAKMRLCERAEELLVESSVIKAFNTLQKLHERWREIGPVPGDKKDEIWERFKTATSKINKKHQEFFDGKKLEQKKNLDAKIVLCEKTEEIGNSVFETNKDWDNKSKELVELQKVWRTIGYAPKRDNNKIYERFRHACDMFFDNRREFYSKNKEQQQNNLQMKIELCVQAELLKDSTDWKKTTQDFINIQKKWKEVGPVPRKHSDQLWKRFRAACDNFFELKSKHFSDVEGEQGENLALKEGLIKEVTDYVLTRDVEKDLKKLKDFQRRWTEIGHVPIKQKDTIQTRFREAINKHFDDLKLDDSKRNMLRFRNKVSNFSETSRGKNKIWQEREKYAIKLKQLENDLVLLDNNIGFFAQSKKAESLIADVNEKIEQTKEKIEMLKKKIRIIDEYEGENE